MKNLSGHVEGVEQKKKQGACHLTNRGENLVRSGKLNLKNNFEKRTVYDAYSTVEWYDFLPCKLYQRIVS